MKKFFIFFFVALLAIAVTAVLARDVILKTTAEQAVTRVTGFNTTIQSLHYDFPSTLQIKGLEIRNPSGFNEKIFVSMPEIYASLILQDLLSGKAAHLQEVRLNLQEVHIEKNEKGISNVELLSSVGKAQKGAQAPPPPAGKKKPIPFLLEKLDLTIRNVSFEDRSGLLGSALGSTPSVVPKRFAMDLNVQNEVFTNIQDPVVLVNLILVKVLNGATLGRLLNINPEKLLSDSMTSAVNSGRAVMTQGTEEFTKQFGNVKGQAANLVKEASVTNITQRAGGLMQGGVSTAKTTLGDTASTAKEQVSSLFGKIKSLQPGTEKSQ